MGRLHNVFPDILHGHQMEHKSKVTGQVSQGDSTFRTTEIAGPPNIEVWLYSFDVLQTAEIMLDVLDLGTMVDYRKLISDYHATYGPACWLLLYQTETSFRLEQLERIRRTTAAAHALALAASGTTPYNPACPWKQSWVDGMKDKEWWGNQFTEPTILFLSRSTQLNQSLGGDAPVSSDGRAGLDVQMAPSRGSKRQHPGSCC